MHQWIGVHLRGLGGVGGRGESAAALDLESEVSAALKPFVGLLGQDGADEADDGVAVRDDPDDIGAATDLAVESLGGVVGPDLAPHVACGTR